MPEKFLGLIPFIGLAIQDGRIKLNVARVIEGVMIAMITASITGWWLKADMQRIEAKVDKVYADIYRPFVPGGGR